MHILYLSMTLAQVICFHKLCKVAQLELVKNMAFYYTFWSTVNLKRLQYFTSTSLSIILHSVLGGVSVVMGKSRIPLPSWTKNFKSMSVVKKKGN